MRSGNGLKTVNVSRERLIKTVKDNFSNHMLKYQEALSDYEKAVVKVCEHNLNLAHNKEYDKWEHIPHAPESSKEHYERALAMLDFSVDDEITLDETTFSQLVLDKWDWTHRFETNNAIYKTLSAR